MEKEKNLHLVGEGIQVNTPESKISVEYENTLNKWRQIFFGLFVTLMLGAVALLWRAFSPNKRDYYEQLLVDFEVYEDEF